MGGSKTDTMLYIALVVLLGLALGQESSSSPTPACLQMLALALLDAVMALDWQGTWLRFMSARGYLQTICASIQWEDEALQKMLLPLPEALRTLYIYESKMVRLF